ncbi:MAG: family N-acetyltransferase [Conexibacter sp.]|nr:family N-acetyltransferase [Conexibacter sp.]
MPMDGALRPAILALEVEPGTERFAGTPLSTVPMAEAHPSREAVAVLRGGVPVGYFQLDRDGVPGAPAGPAILGLRAFFIDRHAQGQGVATAAMQALPAYVRARFPERRIVALTVNVDNPAAIVVYRRAGFVDAGTGLWLGGTAGPQHVLLLDVVA